MVHKYIIAFRSSNMRSNVYNSMYYGYYSLYIAYDVCIIILRWSGEKNSKFLSPCNYYSRTDGWKAIRHCQTPDVLSTRVVSS